MVSSRVVSALINVLATIQLDDDLGGDTDEIANVESDLMLAMEFETAELATPKVIPQEPLGIGGILPHVANVSEHGRSTTPKMGVNMKRIQP